ncbi:hypothetical protein ElyMa_003948600 [Elysia marginata]|uniref:Uncharacterized protein n=1 Tax=Elysia marginata TaxID=1093978 RepID=A0AAV4FUB8_9GAST|nr:hypothetical protein ElyMa_003948600 [Elysia marginata]
MNVTRTLELRSMCYKMGACCVQLQAVVWVCFQMRTQDSSSVESVSLRAVKTAEENTTQGLVMTWKA